MLRIRTVINNEIKYLDLYNNEDITLEVSYGEVQDITSKNSSFTKRFKLPGSNNNNDIFNHFYDFAVSTIDFDVNDKFVAQLEYNGSVLYDGYLRLNSTTRTNDSIVYDVSFYSEVGNLISNIQDKYLNELDFTDYTFTGYSSNLEGYLLDDDLDPTLTADTRPYANGSVYFSILSKGYVYSADTATNAVSELQSGIVPRLNWSIDSSLSASTWNANDKEVPYTYTTPSIRVKDFYERIFSEAGYNINSDFFDTAYFKRYYLPLTIANDSIYLNQAVDPQYTYADSGRLILNQSLTWTDLGDPGTYNGVYRRIDNQFTVVDNMDADQGAPDYITFEQPGLYTATVSWTSEVYLVGTPTPPPGAQIEFQLYLHARDETLSGGTPFWNTGYTITTTPTVMRTVNDATNPSGDIVSETYTFTFDTSQVVGKQFQFDFEVTDPYNVTSNRITDFRMEITAGPKVVVDDTFNVADELAGSELKQIDFISSINKLFNLLVLPEPNDPSTLRVEPIIDWIGKGETLDWSDKVDRSKPITVQPLNTIINGTLNYDYQDDAGYGNETFKARQERKFGRKLVQLSTDYKDKQIKFENLFSAQVDYTLSQDTAVRALTMPFYYITEEEEVDGNVYTQNKPYKTTPKLLFRSVPIPINSSVLNTSQKVNIYPNTNITSWYSNNRCITYPFGVTGLTHYNVWEKTDRLDTTERDLSLYEDMYDVYYKDYILDITNEDNRLVQMSIYLTPEEVHSLKYNEKIFIDNTYFRINKIKNFSVLQPNVAQVELVKLTREYQGHRVKYYDLINCTGGTDLHTNTDLNFGIYAYRDYNIKIDGICYNVVEGVYNSGYTYQKLDITDVYQSGCTCTTTLIGGGGFNGDYYDDYEDNPQPSPLPTPSITPTITPSISITPTPSATQASPTPTPTNTPTPSPSGAEQLIYLVENCDDPGDRRIISSPNFYNPGKVIKITANPALCFEVISFTTGTPVDQQTGLDYNDCFGCPR